MRRFSWEKQERQPDQKKNTHTQIHTKLTVNVWSLQNNKSFTFLKDLNCKVKKFFFQLFLGTFDSGKDMYFAAVREKITKANLCQRQSQGVHTNWIQVLVERLST